ncbi:hypothetical protein KY325_05025 [Candidatus Woesearchaeota archaeon]|nr:hypothetical protein [Candidatus Woesearchaeota archaeon]MBW3018496.1 hypothetical protein [Candidatus Woesearchaeota archaeon]
MTDSRATGEEKLDLLSWCAAKAAANIHDLRHFYPFEQDDKGSTKIDPRYGPGDLHTHMGSHEIVGGLVKKIFEEVDANFPDMLPNLLVYCNGQEAEEFRLALKGACRLTFASDEKDAIRLLQENRYDALVLGFSTAKAMEAGTNRSKSLYFGTKKEPYILNHQAPGMKKILLAIPQFQEKDHPMLFNYIFDKPLDPRARIYQYLMPARQPERILQLEEALNLILGKEDRISLLVLSRLLCNYCEPPSHIRQSEQKFKINGYKANQTVRRTREKQEAK